MSKQSPDCRKPEIACAEAAKAMIMIMREVGVSNGGVPCDTPCGPCSCGAWQSPGESGGRVLTMRGAMAAKFPAKPDTYPTGERGE